MNAEKTSEKPDFQKLATAKTKKIKKTPLHPDLVGLDGLDFQTSKMFDLPIWSPTLKIYRQKYKDRRKDFKTVDTIQKKQDWSFDDLDSNDPNGFENGEEEEEEREQEKARNQNPNELTSDSEIEQVRRNSANFYCLMGDFAIDETIDRTTKYHVKQDPKGDERRKHLENAIYKMMERKNHVPNIYEEMMTAFGIYGYYKFKNLEKTDEKNKKKQEAQKRDLSDVFDSKVTKRKDEEAVVIKDNNKPNKNKKGLERFL